MTLPARLALAGFLVVAGLASHAQLRPSQPEAATGWTPNKLAHARVHMVATANPHATDAGLRMLELGGSAIDAMIAAQLVLTLVEPQSSGLGGGAYLLHYDAKSKSIAAYDGRETAPAAATPDLFMKDGRPLGYFEAAVGGRAVGTPGVPRLLEVAHARHGKLAWATLFRPAIELAEKGFPVSPRLNRLLAQDRELVREPAARDYFYVEGRPRAVGTILRNPALAQTLRLLAEKGADAFYTGEIAADIVAAVRNHPKNPGKLSLEDLAGYRVRDVEALCGHYRKLHLCGMPPSSSGGIAVLQILALLEKQDLAALRPDSAQAVHLFSEAGRLAYADRLRYVADDHFVDVPVQGLLDAGYLAARARAIAPEKSMGRAAPGTPPGLRVAFADDRHEEVSGTSQVAIVDRWGNAVSLTTSVEGGFGAKQLVRGFLLNNQLTDFSFTPVEDGVALANRVAPGKRPRSAMAPFLVFDAASGALDMVIGSPGGSLIINYVAKTIVAAYDWNLDMQAAIDLPNRGSRNGPTEVEKGTELEGTIAALKAMGHDARAIEMTSGLQGIRRTKAGWEGGADPRREGVARGR
ncbi:gamma-glutamyltransferase [Usitatibacter palustris]|uniref:Glutathione hydrolase proenzyme n=1 Tax=Usitatibacter palustris TaxID=2732487 RepID=A0A6M4HBB5_9PROT|nr:gamma-glutamyltransferase [Usitatibacter palustris]QJR16148.1 Glutathione hydrolase proenzyme [Usitatibacter palustris]